MVNLGLLLDLGFREVPCIVVVVAVGWPLLGVSVVGVLEFKFDVPIRIIFMDRAKLFNFKRQAKGHQPARGGVINDHI